MAIDTTATSGGGIYVATGNAGFKPNERMYSEYVVNLSPNLTKVISYASPVLPTGDYDYGSNPVVFKPTGCSTKMLAVKNKSGLLVIESIANTGALSVTQTIQVSNTVNMIGNAAWDSTDQLLLVTTPAAGPAPFNNPGLYAFSPQSGCTQFNLAWSTQANIHGTVFPLGQLSSPTVANGVVYFSGSGTLPLLLAVAANNGPGYAAGQVLWQSPTSTGCLGAAPQTAPVVANGWVYQSCIGNNATVRAFSIGGN